MKFNNPLPQPLPKECAKAARIFKSFVDSGNNGLDGVIPRSILENAKGFAIFTVFKAGFLFSARAGSGVVIAKLPNGSWSAPSAIGTAGVGVGGQAGAEMTDFLIVLNSESSIRSFMSAGSLQLGGNLSIALGPLGRNGEAIGSVNTSGKVAAMYSYSKTKGLFGGVSVEGSVIVERQDANALAYGTDVSVKSLLSGNVAPPDWASPLYQTLDSCTGFRGNSKWVDDMPANQGYAFEGVSSPGKETSVRPKKLRHASKPSFPPSTWGQQKSTGSYFDSEYNQQEGTSPILRSGAPYSATGPPAWDNRSATANFETKFDSDFTPEPQQGKSSHQRNFSMPVAHANPFDSDPVPAYGSSAAYSKQRSSSYSVNPHSPYNTSPWFPPSDPSPASSSGGLYAEDTGSGHPYVSMKPELSQPLSPAQGVARAIALFDFNAVEPGDLSFTKGQVITITEKSSTSDTWWKGTLEGRVGIFPANFVEIV